MHEGRWKGGRGERERERGWRREKRGVRGGEVIYIYKDLDKLRMLKQTAAFQIHCFFLSNNETDL